MDFLCFYFPLFCIHWLMAYNIFALDNRTEFYFEKIYNKSVFYLL